ncbi:hypothetical protein D3C75_185200 [compost metagenome]
MNKLIQKAVATINKKYAVDLNNLNINLTNHVHRKLLDLIGSVDKNMVMSSHELAQMATEFKEDGKEVRVSDINESVRTVLKNEYGIVVAIFDDLLSKGYQHGDHRADNIPFTIDTKYKLLEGVEFSYNSRGYITFYLDQVHAMFVITNYSSRVKMAILRTFQMVKEVNDEYHTLLLEQSKRVIGAYRTFAGHNDWIRVNDRMRQAMKISRKTFRTLLQDIGTSQNLKDFAFSEKVNSSNHARMIPHHVNHGLNESVQVGMNPYVSIELFNALRRKYPEETIDVEAGELIGI